MNTDADAKRTRMAEHRKFWGEQGCSLLTLYVPTEDKAEIEAIARVKIGEHLLEKVKSCIYEPDLEPYRHRKHLPIPAYVDAATLRRDFMNLKRQTKSLRDRLMEFEEAFANLADAHRICETGEGTDFELKQAWSLRYAYSYIVSGKLYLLRKELNERPSKPPEERQPEVFNTEPRPEFQSSGDGEDAD